MPIELLVFKYRVARWVCSELGTLSYEPVFEVSKEPVKKAKFEITFKVGPTYYFYNLVKLGPHSSFL